MKIQIMRLGRKHTSKLKRENRIHGRVTIYEEIMAENSPVEMADINLPNQDVYKRDALFTSVPWVHKEGLLCLIRN